MNDPRLDLRGRGAVSNPPNRFESLSLHLELTDESLFPEEERVQPTTRLFRDTSRTIVNKNDSPDVGFEYSINPYRGCEHGCAYCYARPTHEYLGYSAGLDFESKIFVKDKAPELLREKLMSRSWQPASLFFSGITDCYQPIERRLRITRGCLEVLREFRNPAGIITKNQLITRDIDILQDMAKLNGIMVFLSVTTLDADLGGKLEPRTSRPQARLKAIEELARHGIPVGVNVAPVIPGLTDHELPSILKAAADAGARWAGYTPVRLPGAVLNVFTEWLDTHKPERKEKILSAIRDVRGGKLNDPRFGSRMRGEGAIAENLRQMFKIYTRRENLNREDLHLTTEHFSRPGDQLSFL
ncbi:MAG: PA0069 family radical SAM protein [Bdellovibrionaceae bacterium]|nr:PA0069 family radical SAM protein [Pseudobdellovibrionaceae bacterium]